MSEYVLSLIHIIKKEMIDKATHFFIYNLDSNEEIKNIVKFFLKKSDDDTTQNNKNKIIKQNITYFACMLARFSDEKEFEEFLDDYKININSTEEKTILFIFFLNGITPLLSSIYNDHDTLKVILTKYKDEVDINYISPDKIYALQLICSISEDLKEGSEMLLENKNLKYSAENCISPIYIALYCKNYKLFLRFIKEPQLDINAPIDKEQSLFTTLFKQKLNKSHYGGTDINKFVLFVNKAIDELMRRSDLKIFGNYEYSHISIHESMHKKTKYYDWMNSFSDYIQSIFEYLMSSSEDEIINKNKEKAIDDNKIALACFAAKYLDESILGQFLDDYKIDINSVEENTILYIYIF